MRRVEIDPRPNMRRLLGSQGLVFSSEPGKEPYWPDDRYYSFTSKEIELMKTAGKEVYEMCCEAAEYLVDHPDILVQKMAIPSFALDQIKESWKRGHDWGSIYGRFDFSFGGLDHPDPRLRTPKFYEFNADTPTSLVEGACIQELWLRQTGHGQSQFNTLTEDLIEAWKRQMPLIDKKLNMKDRKAKVYFASCRQEKTGEDAMTTALLNDTCQQAGWPTQSVFMDQIHFDQDRGLCDHNGEHIDVLFKLYPYEHVAEDADAEKYFKDMGKVGGTIWIEPPYKMLWSNKALFAILWDLFKDDPRSKWLLPTYIESEKPDTLTAYARKPIFSREGHSTTLYKDESVIADLPSKWFGKEGYVVQELSMPAQFRDGRENIKYPVLGLWFVNGCPSGLGVREDASPITSTACVYVPHSISDGPMTYDREPVPTLDEIEASMNLANYLNVSNGLSLDDYVSGNMNDGPCINVTVVRGDVGQENVEDIYKKSILCE
ncbi:glutathionylspermidine synthase [Metarhizium rileyi]|uniref:Glutathionylspermidine synthase n=1 Tax=Metarhizium rileyi (strain RCEF 4871) TaxID=1649241 RepID=A0A167BYN0_METRR|nr:glutathionylspermidine synthase [Metarhizium rileyi RCEF 4871]